MSWSRNTVLVVAGGLPGAVLGRIVAHSLAEGLLVADLIGLVVLRVHCNDVANTDIRTTLFRRRDSQIGVCVSSLVAFAGAQPVRGKGAVISQERASSIQDRALALLQAP